MAVLTKTPTVLKMLKEDHKKVKAIFDEFEEASDKRKKARLVLEGVNELEVHAALEEEIVYPAIRGELDEVELMDEALEEHHVANMFISELKEMSPEDERYFAKFTVLAESVRHHIKEEEGEMFPQAVEAEIEWEDLQQSVERRKEQLMAQRQHNSPTRTKR